MLSAKLEKQIEELTHKYMSAKGKCETVAGEILRAYNRIAYRYYNDGDVAGEGYGRETVNPAVRYLFSQLQGMEQLFEIDRYDNAIYYYGNDYEAILEKLGFMILENFKKHPEKFTAKNYEDMWDYKEKCDVDADDEDEDEDEDDWDEDEDLDESLSYEEGRRYLIPLRETEGKVIRLKLVEKETYTGKLVDFDRDGVQLGWTWVEPGKYRIEGTITPWKNIESIEFVKETGRRIF